MYGLRFLLVTCLRAVVTRSSKIHPLAERSRRSACTLSGRPSGCWCLACSLSLFHLSHETKMTVQSGATQTSIGGFFVLWYLETTYLSSFVARIVDVLVRLSHGHSHAGWWSNRAQVLFFVLHRLFLWRLYLSLLGSILLTVSQKEIVGVDQWLSGFMVT